MTVGLTGGYCSGKDEVARIFEKCGFHVIDEDGIGHAVLDGKAGEVIAAFGPGVGKSDGRVDRKALSRIVFSSPSALARLEAIVHPAMVAATAARVRAGGNKVLINAAILSKMGLDSLCDAVVCVKSPAVLRALRAMRRDGISLPNAFRRVLSQKGTGPKSYGRAVDIYTIANRGTLRSLEGAAKAVLRQLERGWAH
jgi:dephospho-CoA kinase